MRPISPRFRKMIDADPYFKTCVRAHEGDCSGRITIEHVFIYQGRQIDEMFNFLPLCWRHHLVDNNKRYNEFKSLQRATEDELAKYPKKDWKQLKKYLDKIYDH